MAVRAAALEGCCFISRLPHPLPHSSCSLPLSRSLARISPCDRQLGQASKPAGDPEQSILPVCASRKEAAAGSEKERQQRKASKHLKPKASRDKYRRRFQERIEIFLSIYPFIYIYTHTDIYVYIHFYTHAHSYLSIRIYICLYVF